MLNKFKKLDPLNMRLHFKKTHKIKYQQEICNRKIIEESAADNHKFIKYYDNTKIDAFERQVLTPLTQEQEEQLINQEKDLTGERHWGAPITQSDFKFLQEQSKKVETFNVDKVYFSQV